MKKLCEPDAFDILENTNKEVLYHGVMRNNHSVAIFKSWIFDPIFPKANKRTSHYLRFSAESTPHEDKISIIQKVCSYTFLKDEEQIIYLTIKNQDLHLISFFHTTVAICSKVGHKISSYSFDKVYSRFR